MNNRTSLACSFLVGFLAFLPSSIVNASTCDAYDAGVQVGTIEDETLDETSGVVASQINAGLYWTHNDSGSGPEVYAITESGDVEATVSVTGAVALDWEDIALGPCEEACACLYIADIGDNQEARPEVTVYRVPEPLVGEGLGSTEAAAELVFRYPDGPHNAETLLVDPRDGSLFVVTKSSTGISGVYRYPGEAPDGSVVVLEKVAEISVQGEDPDDVYATGGDVSPDGSRLVIRTLRHAQEYVIPEGAALETAFDAEPLVFDLPDSSQGEAIAYEADGQALLTLSENVPSPIHEVSCVSGDAFAEPVEALATVCDDAGGCQSPKGRALVVPGIVAFVFLGLSRRRVF